MPGLRRSEVATLAGLSVEYSPASSGARSRAHHPASWKRSSGRCSSTTPNTPTSSTSPTPRMASRPRAAPGVAPRPRPPPGRACSGRWRPSPTASRSSGPAQPPRHQHPRPSSTRPSSARVVARRTWPGSSSSILPRATSTRIGTCSPRCASASCEPRPDAIRTTGVFKTSSASSRHAARRSGDSGPTTMSAPTAPAPRFRHPVVGELTLAYEELAIAANPGSSSSSTPPTRIPVRRAARSPRVVGGIS